MATEKKIYILLWIVAFSALFWWVQAHSVLLYSLAFWCIRLVGVVCLHHHLPVEYKEPIQRYGISLSGSILILLLLYWFSTWQRIIACIAMGMLVTLLWALGDRWSIWTRRYRWVTQIHDEVFIYSVAFVVSFWIRMVNGKSLGKTVYLLIPFVFWTLVVLGNLLKWSPPQQLRHNIVILLSFWVVILVSVWLCIGFVVQYMFS